MTSAALAQRTGLLRDDLQRVAGAQPVWEELRGRRIFVTGGTGFFGKWLLETFALANARWNLGAELVALSRDPQRFAAAMPHLAQANCIDFCKGDVRTFDFPAGPFSHVIHAATEASAALDEQSPDTMFDVVVRGTGRVLEFCRGCGAERLLFISSGAVYGRQPEGVTHVHEDYADAFDDSRLTSAYGRGKRRAERECVEASSRYGFDVAIARGFAFVGPHLPLDRHFAIGNFLRDALAGRSIKVRDGRPYRSYMYASDLALWLWTILVHGKSCRPYNVGSGEAIAIADVARSVADLVQVPVEIAKTTFQSDVARPSYYVPDISRAQRELGLTIETGFAQAIERTFAWYSQNRAA
jgi:dTDP-glucose 4,6-dehydratase